MLVRRKRSWRHAFIDAAFAFAFAFAWKARESAAGELEGGLERLSPPSSAHVPVNCEPAIISRRAAVAQVA